MNRIKHVLRIASEKPPVVEFDSSSGAIYVRFSKKPVLKTLERDADALIVTVDVDKAGGVVGIEAIGFDEFSLSGILRMAKVRADNVDFAKARFRGTPKFTEGETVLE